MVKRWRLWAALCALSLLGFGVGNAQPFPPHPDHERPRPPEPQRAPPPRPDMRPQMQPQLRPALAPFRQPAAPGYAPPPPPFRPPYPPYGRGPGGIGWSGGYDPPAGWDIDAAQNNFNQTILILQQQHNDGVVALQQQFNTGQITEAQMEFGIEELGRRYDEAVAYQ